MSRLFTLLVLVAAVTWFVKRYAPSALKGFAPPAGLFSIRFAVGKPVETEGVIPRTVYDGLCDVAQRQSLNGLVTLAPDGQLLCSDEIPEEAACQMRNTFLATRSF